MYTVTTKEVLTPIAECVSELIQVVTDSQSKNTPLADLTALARIMDEQVQQLISVARSIQSNTPDDAILAQELPRACDEVSVASLMLVGATDDLKNDPFAKAPKQTMLDAIKGVLSGTTHLIYAVDDSDVRKIVTACDTAIKLYSAIPTTSIAPPQPLIHLIQQTSTVLVTVVQLSTKRVSELLQPMLQTRLKGALQSLQRESPLLITATKSLILGGGKPEAAESVRDIVARLVKSLLEIKIIVQIREDDQTDIKFKYDIGRQRASLLRVQRGLCPKIVAGETTVVTELLDEIVDLSSGTAKMTQDAIKEVKNPMGAVRVEALVRDLNGLTSRVKEAVARALADPTNAEYRRELQNLLDSQSNRINLLEDELRRAIISELEQEFADLNEKNETGTSKRLQDAAANGDKDLTASVSAGFKERTNNIVRLATLAIETTGAANPQLAEEIKIKIAASQGLANSFAAASQALSQNPDDQNAKEHALAVSKAFQAALLELANALVQQEGLFNGYELIAAAKTSLEAAMLNFQKAVADGEMEKIKRAGAALPLAADRVIAIANTELENSADQGYKEELAIVIKKAQAGKCLREHWTTRAVTSPVGVEERVGNFKEATVALMEVMNLLRDAMISSRGTSLDNVPAPLRPLPAPPGVTAALPALPTPPKAASLPIAEIKNIETVEKVSEEVMANTPTSPVFEVPVPLTPEEAKANPILAAAVDLKIAAAVYVAKDNLIVSKASDISTLFAEMSAVSADLRKSPTPEAKSRFIQLAREIGKCSEDFTAKANEIMKACTDRRLVARLKADIERCLTLGQQIRIVAAVKASEPKDVDNEQQLIVCARNLMKTMQESMVNCEAASLRVPASAGLSNAYFQKRGHASH
ncbi:hypothetical protein SmJEL517_g05898 [Synchytrium microbalum]|uniref:Vinculin n=1 Tax=Synchytrium microbalum TaxID=1806994 RepID=A0A507BZ53_9FUNG|nr:uncharacterized protein SmJEL517_g05898 [Synchytrium microbalum]TPX30553.1 hypothetical protein SmJEL517_g05898 [Synchytrium microbalum]